MKLNINILKHTVILPLFLVICLFLVQTTTIAQDSAGVSNKAVAPVKAKPVKNTFQSVWIIDNQTVMVPVKGTFEMDIQHRFGLVGNGYEDFFGWFAPSNIRLGFAYAPIDNLNLGFGITKENMLWDASAKYAIIKQTKGESPVSVTYYGNMGIDTRKNTDGEIFKYGSQRLSFFNQIIIARKISDKFSIQVAPSISHQNSVNGYYTKYDSAEQIIFSEMKHNHFALAIYGRYKVTNAMSIIVGYDQPLTKHATNNPNPNLSFGVEFNTSNHSFQIFMGNYRSLSPQRNNLYNQNNPFKYTDNATNEEVKGGEFCIGFNITRLWNY